MPTKRVQKVKKSALPYAKSKLTRSVVKKVVSNLYKGKPFVSLLCDT